MKTPKADTEPPRLVPCPRSTPICLELSNILDGIGHTPLVRLNGASHESGATILAKAEFLNPGGSIKDRIARFIIEEAEKRGELKPGSTILEVTSGNTGIALAMVGALKHYRVVVMMPRTVSEERRNMIRSFGAELHLLEELHRIQAAVARSIELAREHESIFLPSQFSNEDNPRCHEVTTGPEIIRQTGGDFDAFVMGVGTGGTLMGTARAIRKQHLAARIVAVEPDESAVLSGDTPGPHGIQGLADGFIPEIVDRRLIDEVVRVKTTEARDMADRLAREEGLFVGISAGANILGAMEIGRKLGPGRTVVTMLPDRGERYLSLCGAATPDRADG